MDLSSISTEDLTALQAGDLSRVSSAGLRQYQRQIGIQRLKESDPAQFDISSPEYMAAHGPTLGMSGFDKFRAGWGKSVTDIGRGVGQMVGLTSRDDVKEARKLDAPLMNTGLGKAGDITGSIMTMLPTAAIPGANTYAGAAAIGAGLGLAQPSASTGETVKNGLIGGVLSPAALLASRGLIAGVRGAKSLLVDPFTKAGQERIAERTFQSMAGGADKAAEAASNIRSGLADVLPGAQPTAAELSGNAGIANLERILKNNPELTSAFSDRAQVNRNAMVGALDDMAGDAVTRAAAATARKAGTQDLYQAATKATYGVDDELSNLLRRPVVSKAMERARTLAENQGRPFSFESSPHNPFAGAGGVNATAEKQITGQGLQDLKEALDEMLSDPTSGFTGKAGNTVKDLRGQIVAWMEKANPDFNKARTAYAELSRPLNQMDIGQALKEKLLPAVTDFGAQTRLRPQAFAQAVRAGDATAVNAVGRGGVTMEGVLSPEQMKSVLGIGQQLARRINADELGRAVGSNTGQNIVGQNVLRQLLGPLGLPQSAVERGAGNTLAQGLLGSPAKLLGNLSEPQVLKRLTEIGLNPEQAAQILERASPQQLAGILKMGSAVPAIASGANASRQ